ncbi:uncharacterized threonine-rich GPI-anchored glycoprotein PJ4664.02-like isoform X2 [Mastacembelus armatus]|uniref:uncharacterized threonine-rich GPI-anchored glycoprotein PJ4664.02-like isoform X2 n=1 Tax=Mastacembelus armatus TaxID=205130 RepID=UPI000E4617B2|nr:uncharacterized threonine-rich GPI-anchored glycoprotein PJ4664.02-like isoform X2 [Mastacembelus armatus]
MAMFNKSLVIFALAVAVTLLIVYTKNLIEFSNPDLPERDEEEFLPHTRQKRNALPPQVEYEVDVELNLTDAVTLNYLRSLLSNGSFSLTLGPTVNVTHIDVTTVCSPSSGGYQCRCEDQYRWSCDQCLTFGACDNIMNNTCGCISTIPPDGQYCQSVSLYNFTYCPVTPTPAPALYEYLISIELTISDVAVINELRTILSNISYPISINNHTQISDLNISTVCSPSSGGYQCRCEDQYLWSCDQCLTFGACDNIMNNTCGCINTIPPDGQYCQSVYQHNFTACPVTTPSPAPTSPPALYEYLISIELTISDVAVINELRTILSNISYPISINNHTQISDLNISTVCYPSNSTYQCRCEEQFGWPCHMCSTFGTCDDKVNNTCGCINAVPPDGVYCQPLTDLLICPLPTTPTDSTPNATRMHNTTTSTPPLLTNETTVATTAVNTTIINPVTTPALTSQNTTVSSSTSEATTMMTTMVNNTVPTMNSTTAIATIPTMSTTTANTTIPATDTTTINATIPTMSTTTANTTIPATDTTTINATIPTMSTTTANTTIPATDTTTINATIPTMSTTTANTTIPATDTTTINATIPTMSTTTANTTIPTTDTTTINATIPTMSTTTANTTIPATDTTTINATIPTMSTTTANTTIPATDTTTINATIPTMSTTTANTTIPATDTTTINATIPTMSTTTANTTIPTTDTTTINATIPTMSTTTANTTIPATDTTTINATIPTMSTTTANTTIPTTDTTTINATIPTMSTTTANTTIPTMDTTTINATIPTMSTTTANTTIPTTDTTTINATIPTMSTTTANTTTPTTDTTTINATIPTMSTTTANTTTPTTDTTTINATIPTMSTTTANTTIPTMETTTINATIPTMSTTTANTTIPTTDTTTINATIPTMSTTTANTTIPTMDTTTINATIPTMSTTTANRTVPSMDTTTINATIPTMSTTMVNTTIPTTVTTIASTANSTMTTADTTAPINSTTTASTIVATTMTTASTTVSTTTANTTVSTITTVASTTVPITTTTTTTTNIGTSDTTASTVSTTTVTSTTSTAPTEFGVDMSVTLDKEYTEGLNDITSPEFKNLTSSIQPVLERQYKGITGFKRVVVKGFRKGSVITDFVIETTQVNSNEIAEANLKLPEAMKPIAPVIGSVSAVYISAYPISIPDLTYTGSSMTLTCGPPPKDFNVGQISGSVWKFNGLEIKDGGRIKINNTTNTSVLIVNNVINADVGLYECTLRGTVIDFLQTGTVRENQIKQAPIVQLQSQINIQCKEGQIQPLECCVQQPYTVQWLQGTTVLISDPTNGTENYCIKYNYRIESCSISQDKTISFICRVNQPQGYEMTMTLTIFNSGAIRCNDTQYGTGRADDMSVIGCDKGQEGSKTAICQETGEWRLVRDTCIITKIKELLTESQAMVVKKVPEFVMALSQTVQQEETKVINSSTTISAIVGILNNIANVSTEVNATVMQNILNTVDVIIGDGATQSWAVLNANESLNTSSELLGSMETLSNRLVGEFANSNQRILLNRTMFNNSFHADLNSSIIIDIPNTGITNTFITTITFSTLNNVMPVRNSAFNATNNETAINAAVVLVKINATIQNVTLSYNKVNKSLTLNPQCVFWNFTLLQNLGAWDDTWCEFVSDINNTVTCRCNHLTSFSLLMATDIPPSLTEALDIITYVGVGISLASLVICLIIEGYVWKAVTRNSTAFMRHVSIVNTALSLLIADICFIIAAAIANNPLENQGKDLTLPVGPCSTVTFFMHFFYLALFFWMLVSGLLLFYRTVMVFSHMSKSTMLAIGFSLGYGCPLIIAAITVAVTAPGHGYIRKTDGCWLNWSETKALLALVIPALTIVLINMLIVIVVLFKMLRRGVGDITQRDERHTLVVVARCVIILTPLFGLTWSLGVGTMVSSTNKGIHIAFAFFNSLQGFFILVFGTLFDSKICSILSRTSTGSSPRSTSGGFSSLSGQNLINRLRGRRYVYHVSTAANTSSTGVSESYVSF